MPCCSVWSKSRANTASKNNQNDKIHGKNKKNEKNDKNDKNKANKNSSSSSSSGSSSQQHLVHLAAGPDRRDIRRLGRRVRPEGNPCPRAGWISMLPLKWLRK